MIAPLPLLTCPTGPQTNLTGPCEEPPPGCGSTNLTSPDREGLIDCCDCGIWFHPTREYGPDWAARYRLALPEEAS